ncbi:glycosyltransferase family 4 protein [Rhodospirillaceae bacterium SYSU D60014]|uniref:glycosyltransferase family 4 protein n=1 Tax=Virgifigura deserti TaxID=2268457 RepID=UPI0013C3E91F
MSRLRQFLARHLPGPARALARDTHHRLRRWNAAHRARPSVEEFDLVFIIPPKCEGWILEAICAEIGRRTDGRWIIIENQPPFPKARTYFFAHQWVYLKHRRDSPHFKSANLLVWFTHPSPIPYSEKEIVDGLNDSTKVIFSCSAFARAMVAKGLREDRAAVVLGAADPLLFRPHRRSGVGAVGFVSAFYERKNPDMILQIVQRMPHRRFLLVGRNWKDYPRFAELEACPNFRYWELDYAAYPDAYAQMDVFVSPSLLEGGPIPLVEAMMSNVVPVASRTGFAPDLIADGENGFLFEPGAPTERICALIERAFELDTDVRGTVEHYDWDNFARRILDFAVSMPGDRSRITIAWYAPERDPQVASLRYRCFLPAAHLEALGFDSVFISRTNLKEVRKADCLVIVKYFDPWSLAAAHLADDAGIPVLLDQCENIWHPSYRGASGKVWRKYFDALAALASAVITPSLFLADIARRSLPRELPVLMVPDPVESEADWRLVTAMLRRQGGASQPKGTRQKSSAVATVASGLPGKRILWFGNHGSGHAKGMLSLLSIAPILERISRDIPLHLVVASNSRDKYDRYIEPLALPTAYVDWDPVAIHELIRSADLCVMPNPTDDLMLAKSSNRITLALGHGTPVVATMLPALEPLKACIVADDWEHGIRAYLTDPVLVKRHLDSAAAIIAADYSGAAVATKWAETLRSALPVRASPPRSARTSSAETRLLIAVTLPQDLDLLLPIIAAARQRTDLVPTIAVPQGVLTESPRVYRALLEMQIVPRVVTEAEILNGALWVDQAYDALLTAAESDLPAHRLGHALTRHGRSRGVRTYTVQHGYENVGLTYFDSVHDRTVSFASATIFTWQDLSRLETAVSPETLARCVAVGCPKPIQPAATPLPIEATTGVTVAVFENLHWHRFSDLYRRQFIADLCATARALPEWRFLVKPHHAGRWLNHGRRRALSESRNILLIDPADPRWEAFTAPALIAHADAVISTPSTAILDAARVGLPAAVAGYDLNLPLYRPLPILREEADWLRFLRDSDRAQLLTLGRSFVDKAVLPGDGAARILDRIIEDAVSRRARRSVPSAQAVSSGGASECSSQREKPGRQ